MHPIAPYHYLSPLEAGKGTVGGGVTVYFVTWLKGSLSRDFRL
jgi:hypothetical protein